MSRDSARGGSTVTWSLCVPTRNRRATLDVCLRQAALQSPAPSQIVVVDSSCADKQAHDLIAELAQQFPHIDWVHDVFAVQILTQQRQHSIRLATGDIVFALDDDSILYPGTAQAVLDVYEADADEKIAGVELCEWLGPPNGVIVDDSADPFDQRRLGRATPANRFLAGKDWLLSRCLMFDPRTTFVPYDGHFHQGAMPHLCDDIDTEPVDLMVGYRMTYRRNVIADLELTPEFLGYTPVEDFDLSYRASRRGLLVSARLAGVYHHRAEAGRLSRTQLESKSLLNLALLVRRHAGDQRWARRRYYRNAACRGAANLMRDLGKRRLSLPTMRGTLTGIVIGRRILRAPDDTYAALYSQHQERYLAVSATQLGELQPASIT